MRIKRLVLILISVVVLPTLLYFSVDNLGKRTQEESYQLACEGIKRAAVECYALEGFYPPSIDYLTERYGLVIDSERYFVAYQYIASNLMPDITVISLDDSK